MPKVLFVCLGNICRSPMAEGLFIHKVKAAGLERQFEIDSAGTGGWHIGERADPRMREIAAKHGVELPSRARKVKDSDFRHFDYILAMDESNLRDLQDLAEGVADSKAKLFKMRYFDTANQEADVPDPYFGGQGGFEEVYQMLDRSTAQLLVTIREEMEK